MVWAKHPNCWSYNWWRKLLKLQSIESYIWYNGWWERKKGRIKRYKNTGTYMTSSHYQNFFSGLFHWKKSKFTRETHYIWVDLKLSSNSTNSFFEVTYPIFKYVYIISPHSYWIWHNDKEWGFKWRELRFEFTQQIVIVSPLKVNHPSKCV